MIQVLIERYIADGMLSTYEQCSQQTIFKTYAQEGFITAESFTDVDNPNHKFVLSKWRSKHDWKRWAKSEERQALLNAIAPMLTRPEHITLVEN